MTRMMKQLNHFAHKMSKKEHLHHIISNIWTDACSIKIVNTAATTHTGMSVVCYISHSYVIISLCNPVSWLKQHKAGPLGDLSMAKTVEKRTDVYPAGYFMYCILFSLTHYANGLFGFITDLCRVYSELCITVTLAVQSCVCPTDIHWLTDHSACVCPCA